MKYAVLARPSALIVNDMKTLISSAGLEAKPLTNIHQVTKFEAADVGAIVVSTALSSIVKDRYWDVIKQCIRLFPHTPIFLASYASVRSTKITVPSHLASAGVHRTLLSIEEAVKEEFDPRNHLLILTQKEISDPIKFSSIVKLIKSILPKKVST